MPRLRIRVLLRLFGCYLSSRVVVPVGTPKCLFAYTFRLCHN